MIYKWFMDFLKLMQKAIRNFLWTGSIHDSSGTRVAWQSCCSTWTSGFLSMTDFKTFQLGFVE